MNRRDVGSLGRCSLAAVALASLPSFGIAVTSPATPQWTAQWIAATPDASPESIKQQSIEQQSNPAKRLPLFRHGFDLHKPVSKATLTVSGLGQFEAHINGRDVTEAVLTPGWSDFRKRVFYDTYDVTALVRPGKNAIGVMLGNGMYNVEDAEGRYTKFIGSFGRPKLILQLQLRFKDGSEQTIVSDANWKTVEGPISFSSIYGGEDYDARREQPGWDMPVFRDDGWAKAVAVNGPGGELAPESIPPVKAFETYESVKTTQPKLGVRVYDLGQNFAGWPEIEVHGQAGSSVKLIPGELLDADGFVTQRSANTAFPKSQNFFSYVLKGGGPEKWHPRFSYYGFRYVQVETTGVELPTIDHLDGRFLHAAVNLDGRFTTSDDLFNRIHLLINRAMLSNMVSVLTDCPQREKLGWLEQTHLAGASLMYNYDLESFYAKIADDMQDAQLPNGMIPSIAPEYPVFKGGFRDSPEWGSAIILSPWTAYQFYGDLDQLRTHYDSMKRYAAYLQGRSQNHLLLFGLGDWYDIGPENPGESQLTKMGVTASAIYYQSLVAMYHIATLLGYGGDAGGYAKEAIAVKAAFNDRFFHSWTNQYDRGSQTANAMPLALGMVPEERRNAVLANLVADIRKHNNHVTSGDVGFHYVVRALTDNGQSEVLYDMLSRTDKPSYGYQLAHGATALTEAWDANPNSSQNHFMLGHAEEWFYRGLAGIDFDLSREPRERIKIQPAIVGNIQSVAATFQSKLGEIKSAWSRSGDTLKMDVSIPDGAEATIQFPSLYSKSIRLDGHDLAAGQGILSIQNENGVIYCVLAGGSYHFQTQRGSGR